MPAKLSWGCIRSVTCRSPSIGEHCPECLKYMDLAHDLRVLLGVKPCEVEPLDAVREDPPDWMNEQRSGSWSRAWAMRCELEGAG
jgi:hypothetical protein